MYLIYKYTKPSLVAGQQIYELNLPFFVSFIVVISKTITNKHVDCKLVINVCNCTWLKPSFVSGQQIYMNWNSVTESVNPLLTFEFLNLVFIHILSLECTLLYSYFLFYKYFVLFTLYFVFCTWKCGLGS